MAMAPDAGLSAGAIAAGQSYGRRPPSGLASYGERLMTPGTGFSTPSQVPPGMMMTGYAPQALDYSSGGAGLRPATTSGPAPYAFDGPVVAAPAMNPEHMDQGIK